MNRAAPKQFLKRSRQSRLTSRSIILRLSIVSIGVLRVRKIPCETRRSPGTHGPLSAASRADEFGGGAKRSGENFKRGTKSKAIMSCVPCVVMRALEGGNRVKLGACRADDSSVFLVRRGPIVKYCTTVRDGFEPRGRRQEEHKNY